MFPFLVGVLLGWMQEHMILCCSLPTLFKLFRIAEGLMISCIEEIAYRMGFITHQQLADVVKSMHPNNYTEYLQRLVDRK